MRVLLFITVLLFMPVSVIPQVVDRELQIEQVQTAIGNLVSRNHRAEIMLRDLTELEGTVTAMLDDSFSLKIKGANGRRIEAKILYEDVLEVKGKNVSISFIPDQDLRPYGTWDDVLKINYNHNLEIVFENG
jgi:hypothetical protein